MSKRNSRTAKQERRETKQESRIVSPETHEPVNPLRVWPESHANVFITDNAVDECIGVTIHGVTHYLHATTAESLYLSLKSKLHEWDRFARSHGARGVDINWDKE